MRIVTKRIFNKIWAAHTRFIDRFDRWIVLFFILLSVAAAYYAAKNLGINSRTSDMFDSSLPFRSRQNNLNNVFPLSHRNLVIVVQAENPERTDSLTDELARRLKNNHHQFKKVYVPGGGAFFKQNQLLFLSKPQLDSLSTKLARSQVLFSLLSQNYSLRGFFAFLNQVISMANEDQISRLHRLFGEINQTIAARLKGQDFTMSWQRVMTSKKLGRNQNIRFIEVKPFFDYQRLFSAKPAIDTTRKIITQMKAGPGASIRITGNVAMAYQELHSVMSGMLIGGIIAFFLVGLSLWIGLRSFRLLAAAIVSLLVGLALTTGFSALAVGQLNMISIAFAILYIGLGIDYAIHFTLKFNELMHANHTPYRAMEKTFKALVFALLLSTVSTALGFYAFVPTSFSGVSQLGLIAGTGMFISLIVTFTFLPAMLSLLYGSVHLTHSATLSIPGSEQISSFQQRNTLTLRWIGIGTAIVSVLLLFKISFDYNPINLRDPRTEAVSTMKQLIDSKVFTPWSVDIISDDSMQTMRQARELRAKDAVGQVTTLFSFVPDKQRQKLAILHSLQPRYERIPPVKKDSASYKIQNQINAIQNLKTQIGNYRKSKPPGMAALHGTLGRLLDTLSTKNSSQQKRLINDIEKALLKTFPEALSRLKESLTAKQITLSSIPKNLKQHWKSQDKYRIKITPASGYDDDNNSRRAFASALLQFNPAATGNLITIIKSGDTVKNAFIKALTYSLIVIALFLLAYLRSLKYTLYVLLPITLAGLMTCAAMVLLGLQFNFANIIALPLLFGLGVDNGIHIVHQAQLHTITTANMLKSSTARAIFFSALTTLFSFGNMAFSPHTGTASMGIILSLGLIFIIFATLVILPAFLIKNDPPEALN